MIIYTSMVADLFHYGHVNFLKKCRSLDKNVYLIVGVHSDEVCKKYKREPIMTHDERVISLKQCGLVDKIIPNIPLNPSKEFYKNNNIDKVVHAHSEDEDEFYKTLYQHAVDLNIFYRLDYTPGISTTELIKRVIEKNCN